MEDSQKGLDTRIVKAPVLLICPAMTEFPGPAVTGTDSPVRADEDGHLSYVGGTDVKYIPVDEDVELNLGSARLVKVEPVLMNLETSNYLFDNKRNIAGWDEVRSCH